MVRAESFAELMGDLVLDCTGGTPTPEGQPLPQFNFTFYVNANVTSTPLSGNFTEALLIVDEPTSAVNPSRPLLNCGNTGAPDSGGLGAGVCEIVSTGDPGSSYDGTPNGYGAATCDGASGRPSPNSYTCGRPNVFQGQLGAPQNPGQLNAITFYSVPIDPPGNTANRTVRITNLRVNTASLGLPVLTNSGYSTTYVQATISAIGPVAMNIIGAQQILAFAGQGLNADPSSCKPSAPLRVRICEGFAASWKSKNVALAVGNNGVAGNADFPPCCSSSYWTYNGATNYPADIAQNVPGAIYNTETGFEWQNNGPNAPPSPNPPLGIGAIPVTATASPLSSVGYGGANTQINQAGGAASGTRFAFTFTGIPPGASVQVPQVVYLFPSGSLIGIGTYSNGSTGVMVLVNADSAGAGEFSPAASGTLSGNLAVYEVLWATPFAVESAEVPYTLLNASNGTTLQVSVSLAPFYSDGESMTATANRPTPRFISSGNDCGGQSCLNLSPNQGLNSGPTLVSMTYYGAQVLTGAQVLLRANGVPDILGLDTYSPGSNSLAATFELSGATPGSRDVIITPASGPPIILAGGFSVLPAPPCGYSVGPQSMSFPASGGSGTLIVSASAAQCSWSASTGASWITLNPVSGNLPSVETFNVAPNSGSSPLTGTITIAGENVTVSQEGSAACDFSISPSSNIFPTSGGSLTVNITARSGCSWDTVSSLGWLSFSGSSSGSGTGSVTIQVGSNSGGPLGGTLTMAGQTFSIRQDGSACGGIDVSSQVTATRKALIEPYYYAQPWTQELALTNQGGSIAGPVYVVFDGLCHTSGPSYCPFTTQYQITSCNGTSAPMVLVSPNGLAQGQTVNYEVQFYDSPYNVPGDPPVQLLSEVPVNSVSLRVLSGTPSQ